MAERNGSRSRPFFPAPELPVTRENPVDPRLQVVQGEVAPIVGRRVAEDSRILRRFLGTREHRDGGDRLPVRSGHVPAQCDRRGERDARRAAAGGRQLVEWEAPGRVTGGAHLDHPIRRPLGFHPQDPLAQRGNAGAGIRREEEAARADRPQHAGPGRQWRRVGSFHPERRDGGRRQTQGRFSRLRADRRRARESSVRAGDDPSREVRRDAEAAPLRNAVRVAERIGHCSRSAEAAVEVRRGGVRPVERPRRFSPKVRSRGTPATRTGRPAGTFGRRSSGG